MSETSHQQKATRMPTNLHELEITFGANHAAIDLIGDPFALRQEREAATEAEAGQAIGTEHGHRDDVAVNRGHCLIQKGDCNDPGTRDQG